MSSTLSLSALIARLSRDELLALVRSRKVHNAPSVNDPLGLALEYLRPDSITRAISHLDRDALLALSNRAVVEQDSPIARALRSRALVGWDEATDSLVPLAEVSTAIESSVAAAHSEFEQTAPTTEVRDGARAADGWYGQAVAAVRVCTALIRKLRSQPAKMNRKGLVTATTIRTLADQLRADPALVTDLLIAVEWAGLAVGVPDSTDPASAMRLTPTPDAQEWAEHSYPERWVRLATGLHQAITPEIHDALPYAPTDFLSVTSTILLWRYPLLPESALLHAQRIARTAEALGATTHGWCAPPLTELLHHDTAAAHRVAHEGFPPAAPGVYLQPDLTLIAPGPLVAHTEHVLFDLTEIDQLGAAAVLRFTQRSLERALTTGYTTNSIREFLSQVSLTGIPQPLTFMLTDLERERPKLSRPPTQGSSWIAGQLSHAERESSVYPPGNISTPESTSSSDPTSRARPQPTTLQLELVDRVYNAAHLEPGGGDLSRLLELAIRDRSTVQVTAVAGSDQRTFTLLPLAVTGGRLRATDQTAGVERTLPLTAITAVTSA